MGRVFWLGVSSLLMERRRFFLTSTCGGGMLRWCFCVCASGLLEFCSDCVSLCRLCVSSIVRHFCDIVIALRSRLCAHFILRGVVTCFIISRIILTCLLHMENIYLTCIVCGFLRVPLMCCSSDSAALYALCCISHRLHIHRLSVASSVYPSSRRSFVVKGCFHFVLCRVS